MNFARQYKGTSTEGQELDGKLLNEVDGALWTEKIISDNRVPSKVINGYLTYDPCDVYGGNFYYRQIVVGVDPAGTDNPEADETGIVVVGLANDGHAYVLADESGRYTPRQWANITYGLYCEWEADAVVVETNHGSDMVLEVLLGSGEMHVEDVKATERQEDTGARRCS